MKNTTREKSPTRKKKTTVSEAERAVYSELLESGATTSEIQAFLVDSELVPVTIRIPRSLRDSAKEAASLSGLTFTSFVKQSMIEKLSAPRDRK